MIDANRDTLVVFMKKICWIASLVHFRSWFETALDYKPRILGPKIEEFPCWKLGVCFVRCRFFKKRTKKRWHAKPVYYYRGSKSHFFVTMMMAASRASTGITASKKCWCHFRQKGPERPYFLWQPIHLFKWYRLFYITACTQSTMQCRVWGPLYFFLP